MKFTDIAHHIEIELSEIDLFNPLSCKITLLDNNLMWLEGTSRILTGYIREAPLDGKPSAKFTHCLNLAEKYIEITGNVVEAIKALHAYRRISDSVQDEIIMCLITEMNKEAFKALSSGEQSLFMRKIQAAIQPTPPHSPMLFSH